MDDLIKNVPEPHGLDRSLADWVWLGELCRRIVYDEGLAEDAQQAAWLAGAGRPMEGVTRRAQLFWAARRYVTGSRLADARRRRREKAAARHEALPSPADLVERGEQQQRVWSAARALPDPPRTALLLHFQDGLSPKEIAERSGDKVDTVRRRIQRGVALLRERLEADREGGGLLALAMAVPSLRHASPKAASVASSPLFGIAASLGTLAMLKLVAAAALALTLAFLARDQWTREAALEDPQPVEAAEAGELKAIHLEAERLAVVSAVPNAQAPRESIDTAGSPTAAAIDVPTLAGRLILHDVDGTPLPGVYDGSLQLSLFCNGAGQGGVSVEVAASEFTLALAQDSAQGWTLPSWNRSSAFFSRGCEPSTLRAWIEGGELEGLGVFVMLEEEGGAHSRREHIETRFDEPSIELHAQVVPPFTLHVEDAANRNHALHDIDIVVKRRLMPDAFPPRPSENAAVLKTTGSSPITIHPTVDEARKRSVNCYVRSSGFAWTPVELNLASGGERTVTLGRGGSLDVRIQGELPKGAEFRIYRDGESRPVVSRDRPQGTEFTYTNLPTGELVARVELGPWYDERIVLAEQAVRIEPGALVHCVLVLEDHEPPALVQVLGTLRVPTSWDMASPMLFIERVSPTVGSDREQMAFHGVRLPKVEGQLGLFSFDTGGLIPGEHVAMIHELALQIPFTVPEAGLPHLILTVPEPVSVSVLVHDGASGETAKYAEHLSWRTDWPELSGFCPLVTATRTEGDSAFHVRVPRGPVRFHVSGLHCTQGSAVVDATEGLTVELEVRRTATARVDLMAAGKPVAWPSSFPLIVVGIHSGAYSETTGTTQTGRQFSVTTEDRYRVSLPQIDGFAPLEPLELDMRPGDPEQKVTVELQRLP